MKKLFTYPFRFIKLKKMQMKKRDDKFLKSETEFDLILDKLLKSEYRSLHCDVEAKKYYIEGKNAIIAVNGNNDKVYMLYTEGDMKIPVNYDFRESYVSKVISKIINEKHRESEMIYNRIQEFETLLNTRILENI